MRKKSALFILICRGMLTVHPFNHHFALESTVQCYWICLWCRGAWCHLYIVLCLCSQDQSFFVHKFALRGYVKICSLFSVQWYT